MRKTQSTNNKTSGFAACSALSIALAAVSPEAAHAQPNPPRIDLQILVISDGDVGTKAFKAALDEGLVPYTDFKINVSSRTEKITDAFLTEETSTGARAKFQAVVLPNAKPEHLEAAELTALATFERRFHIREFDAYVYPSSDVGLMPPDPLAGGYTGPLDKLKATVSDAGRNGPFGYLKGTLDFEDSKPAEEEDTESYGYLSKALENGQTAEGSFTTFVSGTITKPGGGKADGVVLGVFSAAGREQLVLTASTNENQWQHRVLFPGILNWLTYGVHLGTDRNYFAVHIDDVFLPDARWNIEHHCTPDPKDASCKAPPSDDILMTAKDVDNLEKWQNTNDLKLDLVFNGGGYDDAKDGTTDHPKRTELVALGEYLLGKQGSFRWINHTYRHTPLFMSDYETLHDEIAANIAFGRSKLDVFSPSELVTGQHSGLRTLTQGDNPNLAAALTANEILWIGTDSSIEAGQRTIVDPRDMKDTSTLTVPRYPMNIFYNVGTKAEEVAEYNWIYALPQNVEPEVGNCKPTLTTTCMDKPLPSPDSFESYIVPQEARLALAHILANDPRPHYVHQSNLAEDGTLYPVLKALLAQYTATFTGASPLVNATMTMFGTELQKQTSWRKRDKASPVAAYIQGQQLFVQGQRDAADVPLTLPFDSDAPKIDGLAQYGSSNTGWRHASVSEPESIALPSSVAYVDNGPTNAN